MPQLQTMGTLTVLASAALLSAASPVMAQSSLGCAQSFGVLGASTVTNTNATTIKGNLGVSPGSSITGLASVTLVNGAVQSVAVSGAAQGCATTAFTTLFALGSTPLAGDLGLLSSALAPLTPGVYSYTSSAQLTGNLFLDFLGNPNSLFVFQIGTGLTTASNANVFISNGGPFGEVYWLVGSQATLGTGTVFQGNIIANTESIVLNSTAKIVCGRAIALTAAVTMDNNVISSDCSNQGDFGTGNSDFGSNGFSGGSLAVVPEPSTLALLVVPFCVGLVAFVRRGRRSH